MVPSREKGKHVSYTIFPQSVWGTNCTVNTQCTHANANKWCPIHDDACGIYLVKYWILKWYRPEKKKPKQTISKEQKKTGDSEPTDLVTRRNEVRYDVAVLATMVVLVYLTTRPDDSGAFDMKRKYNRKTMFDSPNMTKKILTLAVLRNDPKLLSIT